MGSQLSVQAGPNSVKAEGCCTPKEDKQPQKMSVAPKRVLPIIFIPGIMGSNLRMKAKRQDKLKKSNNISWRPDRKKEALALIIASPAKRQLQLDPEETEVDIYDPQQNLTGDKSETAEERHDLGILHVHLNPGIDTPLLTDDPVGTRNRKTKEAKAKERGWGEVYFASYRMILEVCEEAFNQPCSLHWKRIFGESPASWGAAQPALKPLLETEYKKAVAGCWFPVHAMGYNWLKSNADSARILSKRISSLMDKYRGQGYECEKVVVVTHSMGGLVARALVHPEFGGLTKEVLGIVHGVMPAIGAPATYKRMRCGFEEAFGGFDPTPKVLGNFGPDVTAVLANGQGGLELLPSKAYGNGWLEIRQDGRLLKSLPENGDPYTEIYTVQGKWYGLLRDDWINPGGVSGHGYAYTCELLGRAKKFHETIASFYHQVSYAHYGVSSTRPSWERVVWNFEKKCSIKGWEDLYIVSDSRQGKLDLLDADSGSDFNVGFSIDGIEAAPAVPLGARRVLLGESSGPGDQTVPMRSAEDQLMSGMFSGVFRQTGYEHQGSYCDINAINSTLFSLCRIIGLMKWEEHD